MNLNTFQFKQTPVAIAIDAIANDAAQSVTTFAWHDVFYAGEHTDMKGNKNAFTRKDLEQIVANFAANKAPLVIGHPETNAPAYGWVSDIRVTDDNRIEVQADNVNVEFAKAVAAKAFPNRSVKIFKGKNGWQLAHIGYLGAAPPALEGMPWQFSASESDATFEYALENILVRFMRRIREWIIDKEDTEQANNVIPDWEIEELSNLINAESTKDHLTPHYAKPPAQSKTQENDVRKFTQEQLDAAIKQAVDDASASFTQQLTDIQTKADAAEAKLAEVAAEKQKAEHAASVNKFQALIDGLVQKGVLVPAQASGAAEFMASLNQLDTNEFSFSQGDKEIRETPAAFAERFFTSLGSVKSPLGDDVELKTIDNDDLDARATAYAKEHNCSYGQAVVAVSGE